MLEIGFAKPTLPRSGALVLLVGEGDKPGGLWAEADAATNGAIARALAAAEFKGGKGKTCTILAPGGDLTRVVAVGLGKLADLNARTLQDAGGNAAAALSRDVAAAVAADGLQAAQAAEVALGAVLAHLSLRPLPHQGEAGGQAAPRQPDVAARRYAGSAVGLGAARPASHTASTSRATWSASRPTC